MTTDPFTGAPKYDPSRPPTREQIIRARYERRIAKRDEHIASLEKKIENLNEKLAAASVDRTWMGKYIQYAIEDVIGNMRLIPRSDAVRVSVKARLAEVDAAREHEPGRLPGQKP